MHVAAANPLALDATGVDPATLEREKNVLRDKNAGKPAHVLEKIVESGLKTYFKEVTLVEQAYIHETPRPCRRPSPKPPRPPARRWR